MQGSPLAEQREQLQLRRLLLPLLPTGTRRCDTNSHVGQNVHRLPELTILQADIFLLGVYRVRGKIRQARVDEGTWSR